MASSRPQLSSAGLTPSPPPSMPQQHSLPPGMSPMAPQQPMVPQLGNSGLGQSGMNNGMSNTGYNQQQNNSASALTQTMAPIRPSMPQPPMSSQQPPFLNQGHGQQQSQPSPMRGFLIDEDPDA